MPRVTKTLRDSIVSAVMSEIPNPLPKLCEEARILIQEAAVKALPELAQPVYKLHPDLFKTAFFHFGNTLGGVSHVRCYDSQDWSSKFPKFIDEKLREKLTDLENQAREAKKVRDNARTSLRNSLSALNTVKQLKDTFPQFSKYLPEDMSGEAKSLNALVVADTLQTLRNLGWKDPKPAAQVETPAAPQAFTMEPGVRPAKRSSRRRGTGSQGG